ncbi:Hypothetical protein POVR1_LOCUS71 [uncultured virus]|nr:Hypothetical protein POVR1_LOCUS71 [uncultured virus]
MVLGVAYPICCVKGTIAVNNQCVSCESVLEKSLEDPSKQDLYPFIEKYYSDLTIFNYTKCFGTCQSGQRISSISTSLETCKDLPINLNNCSYPCQNLNYLNSAESALTGLAIELQRGGFLEDVIWKIYQSKVTIAIYPNHLEIQQNSRDPTVLDFIKDVTLAIVPEIPNLNFSRVNTTILIQSHDNITTVEIRSENTIPIVVSSVIGGVIGIMALLGLIYGYYKFQQTNLSVLPDVVAWSFRQYESAFLTKSTWTYCGTGISFGKSESSGFYYKNLEGSDYDYVVTKILKINQAKSVRAIYNPMLISNFIGAYTIQRDRIKTDPSFFQRQTWKESPDRQSHQWVYDQYLETLSKANQCLHVPIVGLWHGTDAMICDKISSTGFMLTGTLDQGWYGRGSYHSSELKYCVPYMVTKKQPVLIFSWVLPGNVYPVIQSHEDPNSLMGGAIRNGYNSHYVVTDRKGYCCKNDKFVGDKYNEFVIAQESQIVPAFIVELEDNYLLNFLNTY